MATLKENVITAFESIQKVNTKANYALNLTGFSLEKQDKLNQFSEQSRKMMTSWTELDKT